MSDDCTKVPYKPFYCPECDKQWVHKGDCPAVDKMRERFEGLVENHIMTEELVEDYLVAPFIV